MRKRASAVILIVLCCAVGAPAVATAEAPLCAPAVVASSTEPITPVADWVENLTYDSAGHLWVSRSFANVVEEYDAQGRKVSSISVSSPGSIRQGPDGLMYAVSGAQTANLVSPMLNGSVVRFDPKNPEPHVFAAELGMPNGLAVDADGSVYVADSRLGILRFHPDGRRDESWNQAVPHPFDVARGIDGFGMNGAVLHDGSLYVTVAETLSGVVLRIPVTDPGTWSVAARLTAESFPLVPDDLTVGSDDMLYVATTSGRLVRIDSTSGQTCTVLQGEPLTSVASVPGGSLLNVGTERGAVLTIRTA